MTEAMVSEAWKNTTNVPHPMYLPKKILRRHLIEEQLRAFTEQNVGIFSVTVLAEKPAR